MEQQDIQGAITAVMESLKDRGLSELTIRGYRFVYNTFEKYLQSNAIDQVNESVCLDYVYVKTGIKFERFECVAGSSPVNNRIRPLFLLLRYLEDGQLEHEIRKIKPPFICPACFQAEYDAFTEDLTYRGYSNATIATNKEKVQKFLTYLFTQKIKSSDEINIQSVEGFLNTFGNIAVKYTGTILYVLRNYLSFLYERGYITNELTPMLPKIRVPRNGAIPYGWSKSDIQKLLGAIDRNDPKGKRDFAMLLIAVRLGLRIGDIRNLKQTAINWQRNTINLMMSKTGQPIELPLLKDVGWAIIDYLQNGRPNTTSDCLFVRHRAPFNSVGTIKSFSRELHRYIVKAGLELPKDRPHGIHSLRNALAGNMLEINAPLPIISESLGHQSVNTTSIYLKIDVEGLRKCAMDPEEVFAL